VAFPTITERPGSLSGNGFAREQVFGTPVLANTFLPMTGNTMDEDPGWFSPTLMQGVRDKQIYNLYGESKFQGTVTGPIFPSNAMELLVASIGQDAAPGYGVTGTTPASATTLGAGITANTNAFTLTSATGYAIGSIIQVDTNVPATPTTTEVRKIATLSGATGTVDVNWVYAHTNGAAVSVVVAPFTHTINQSNTLPSLTVEKNIGGFQSLQFAGCKVNKFDLKAPVGNTAVEMSADMMGQSIAVLNSPTAITVANELPFVFSEASLTVFGSARNDVTNTTVSIENGIKDTYTYSGQHGPSFLTPVSLHTSGTIDVVFDSLTDSTYGDWTRMSNGTLGAYSFTLAHPASAGTITINQPQIALSKYGSDVKVDGVVMSSLSYEASRPLTGGSQYSISATVVNNVYVAY
jgi:Phage tail tube protein